MKNPIRKQPAIIMVAPNGARKTAADHPNLPVSIAATVDEAKRCHAAGASVIHAHVRDEQDGHSLSASLYQSLFAALDDAVPQMLVQMTTEAVGIYTPQQQAASVKEVRPKLASVAMREMAGEGADLEHAQTFYQWCHDNSVHVQHILYDAADVQRFFALKKQGIIAPGRDCLLFVLGRYTADQQSNPEDLQPFLQAVEAHQPLSELDWLTCAFGQREQACMLAAIKHGGHARVGFENNLTLPDGSVASHTADLVAALHKQLQLDGIDIATVDDARAILFH